MDGKKVFGFILLTAILGLVTFNSACKNNGPSNPYDIAFTPTPTPIIHITGSVNVAVQDKSQAVTGLTVYRHPPFRGGYLFRRHNYHGDRRFQPALPGSGELDFRCTGPNALSLRPQHNYHAGLNCQ